MISKSVFTFLSNSAAFLIPFGRLSVNQSLLLCWQNQRKRWGRRRVPSLSISFSKTTFTDFECRSKTETSRGRKTEKEEDEELNREAEEQEVDGPFVFTESPACEFFFSSTYAITNRIAIDVKGGEMREYQVQGLNWMVGLHYNGINGILADEMVSFTI